MDCFSPAFAGYFKNFSDIEIRFASGRRPKQVSFIGFGDMERSAINVRKDSHRGDAHLPAGANDPYCDFTTISNENLGKHSGNLDCNNKLHVLARGHVAGAQ
jgi:hypothetical protein